LQFSPKTIEKLLSAINKAAKDLRPKIGYLRVERVKVGRSEVRVYCTLEGAEGERKILIKYSGEVWVEGPRWVSLPLKNRISYHLRRP